MVKVNGEGGMKKVDLSKKVKSKEEEQEGKKGKN